MLSGLSLGPELPLVLTSGMFGSWLGLVCRQSMLQARVLNLTAASAAIGGFFGFPMAGALFVLELPHRSGLQYFEALTPSTISSIVAVITNRLIVNSDVTGYFKYPFLATSLPSSIFTHAIVYGLYGCAVGTTYLVFVLWCKTWVHDWFHAPREDHHEDDPTTENDDDYATTGELVTNGSPTDVASELDGLLSSQKKQFPVVESAQSLASKAKVWIPKVYSLGCVVLPQEAHRAALAGALAGFLCGWVAIFVPHTLFWGEAQLQSLIDKGRTPLPVIGQTGSPTVDMTALGYCLIDPMDPAAIKAGFSVGCAALISISKTFVIGLSLGTGIIGGHFWGPLFVGCAASHFFSDVVHLVSSWTGVGASLASYPCVVILCTMGAAHVVNFRAHTAIMLILTLTISAFSPEDGNPYFAIAGDYSAVFPLLVISVFISMIISRDMIFYKEQRNRGDILAVPQVLCEPGMEGEPLVANFDSDDESDFDEDGVRGFPSDEDVGDDPEEMDRLEGTEEEELARIAAAPSTVRNVTDGITQDDIEESFRRAAESHAATSRTLYGSVDYGSGSNPSSLRPSPVQSRGQSPVRSNPVSARQSPLPRSTRASPSSVKGTIGVEVPFHTSGQLGTIPPPPRSISPQFSSSRLDELLAMPLEQEPIQMRRSPPSNAHRRVNSLPLNFGDSPPENLPQATESRVAAAAATKTTDSTRQRANSYSRRDLLVRVSSFGEVNHQPSLMEQARMQAASTGHRRVPSLPRGRSSRKNSASSAAELGVDSGALSLEDIEHSFNSLSVVNGRGFQGPTWNQQG
jgi:H+/Cl- antiporter ClcA